MLTNQSNQSRWILKNHASTIKFGESLAQQLSSTKVLLLEGPLGAGKTSLVQGIGKGLEISEQITSPTFALAHHYEQGLSPLVHLDLYRLDDPQNANELFLQEEEEANELGAVMVVEWPERLSLLLPDAWLLTLNYEPNKGRIAQLLIPETEARKDSTSSSLG